MEKPYYSKAPSNLGQTLLSLECLPCRLLVFIIAKTGLALSCFCESLAKHSALVCKSQITGNIRVSSEKYCLLIIGTLFASVG